MKGGYLDGSKLTYARLTSAAYEKAKSPDDIDGYVCERRFGQANSSVYVSEDKKEVCLAIRGTNPKNAEDLLNDGAILFGALSKSKRVKQMNDRLRDIANSYPGYRIVVVGHSLGGAIAIQVLLKNPAAVAEAHVFNSGAGSGDAARAIACKIKNSPDCRVMKQKLHKYIVPGDIISFISKFLPGKSITERSKGPAHTIDNFTMSRPVEAPVELPEPAIPIETPEELSGAGLKYLHLNRAALLSLCKERGVTGVSKLTKHDIAIKLRASRGKKGGMIKECSRGCK